MTDHLTYQWLNPILLGIIGWMIRSYLASMDKKIADIDTKVARHIERVEEFINKADERHFGIDKRVSILENHDLLSDTKR